MWFSSRIWSTVTHVTCASSTIGTLISSLRRSVVASFVAGLEQAGCAHDDREFGVVAAAAQPGRGPATPQVVAADAGTTTIGTVNLEPAPTPSTATSPGTVTRGMEGTLEVE